MATEKARRMARAAGAEIDGGTQTIERGDEDMGNRTVEEIAEAREERERRWRDNKDRMQRKLDRVLAEQEELATLTERIDELLTELAEAEEAEENARSVTVGGGGDEGSEEAYKAHIQAERARQALRELWAEKPWKDPLREAVETVQEDVRGELAKLTDTLAQKRDELLEVVPEAAVGVAHQVDELQRRIKIQRDLVEMADDYREEARGHQLSNWPSFPLEADIKRALKIGPAYNQD